MPVFVDTPPGQNVEGAKSCESDVNESESSPIMPEENAMLDDSRRCAEAIEELIAEWGTEAARAAGGHAFGTRSGDLVLALSTPNVFCVVCLPRQQGFDDGWFDVRCRKITGIIGAEFDFRRALVESNGAPETPLGATEDNGRLLLTCTDQFRFLQAWGFEKIRRVMRLRLGGFLAFEAHRPGLLPVTADFWGACVGRHGEDGFLRLLAGMEE